VAKIFLSYSRVDLAFAQSLSSDLEKLNHIVWLDQELSGGQPWWEKILASIRESDFFIFLLSSSSLDSQACKREYSYAADLFRPILPVLVCDGVSLKLLPQALAQVQLVDYRDRNKDAVEVIFSLNRALQYLAVGVPLPSPLPAPPEVPISYLGNLSDQIAAPAILGFEEQSRLILELKHSLRDLEAFEDTLALLKRMRMRRDLLARIAEEIDELMIISSQVKRPVIRTPFGAVSAASRPPSHATAKPTRQSMFDSIRRGRSLHDNASAAYRMVAKEKPWLHYIMWCTPLANLFWCFASASRIRTARPVRIFWVGGIVLFAICTFVQRISYNFEEAIINSAILFYSCGSLICGTLTHQEILNARARASDMD
jgi:hypothetical protein